MRYIIPLNFEDDIIQMTPFLEISFDLGSVANVKNFFVNVWRKSIFDIYVTEYGTALTTILPILFLYLNTVTVTAGTFEP
jgi:hypothetical protein